MCKIAFLFLLTLLLPLHAVEWRDDVYACEANLPDSPGWVPVRVAEVPGTTVLIAMQNPLRQAAIGVNVLNNPPSTNLNDDATVKFIEQLMHSLTYQFFGRSTVQIGATGWLQYPVTSTSGGLNAKGVIRFTSANGRIYAVSLLLGGGKEPSLDSELQQAAASFRVLAQAPLAAPKPAPVVVAKPEKPAVKKPEPATGPTTPGSAPTEEAEPIDYKRIAIFAGAALFVLYVFFRIIGKGTKPKATPEPKAETKPETKPEPKAVHAPTPKAVLGPAPKATDTPPKKK